MNIDQVRKILLKDKDFRKHYDVNMLRKWRRSQLGLLKLFVENDFVTQKMIADYFYPPKKKWYEFWK